MHSEALWTALVPRFKLTPDEIHNASLAGEGNTDKVLNTLKYQFTYTVE